MRSSKKRSRSSQNRPRTLGNIINRVFDSSGPEGKVRGTPQQIIEKYQMLARDAQLSNDRVAAENFLQHAEHYTRMLAEATREMAAEQESRQQQFQSHGGQQGSGQGGGQNGGQSGGQNGGQTGGQSGGQNGGQPQRYDRQDRPDRSESRSDNRAESRSDSRSEGRSEPRQDTRGDRRPEYSRDQRAERDVAAMEQPSTPDVIEFEAGDDTGLIETPESVAKPMTRPAPRHRPESAAPKPDDRGEAGHEAKAKVESDTPADAPREDRPARRPRGPRKPKAEGNPEGEPPKEAAE